MTEPTGRDGQMARVVTSGDSERPRLDASISQDFFSTAGFALATADQVSTSLWRSIVEVSMTQPQFLVLTELHHTPGIGHHELADRVGIDHATIGPTVRRLTDLELVERHKDPADSRRAVLHATAAATSLIRRTAPLILELNATLMAPLSKTESNAVIQSWSAIGDTRADQWRSERTTSGLETSGIPGLADNPWFHLRRARRANRRTWRDIIGDTTTMTQFSLMHVMARSPGRNIRVTARAASVEETTALRVVMRLVRTRLARDPRDPNDARRSLLSLTPLGQEVHDAVLDQIPEVEQTISSWIPSQVQEFSRLTRAVARLPQRNPELL